MEEFWSKKASEDERERTVGVLLSELSVEEDFLLSTLSSDAIKAARTSGVRDFQISDTDFGMIDELERVLW